MPTPGDSAQFNTERTRPNVCNSIWIPYFNSWSTTRILFLVWPDLNCEGGVLADLFPLSTGVVGWELADSVTLQAFEIFSRILDIWDKVFTQLAQIIFLFSGFKSKYEIESFINDLMIDSISYKAHFLLVKV